jgi:hypothetical protein
MEQITKMLARQKLAEKKTKQESPKECPAGTIRRTAYMRESYFRSSPNKEAKVLVKETVVPADCIKVQGRPKEKAGLYDKSGKRVYIIVDTEKMKKYGYHDLVNKTQEQRHKALDKVYKAMESPTSESSPSTKAWLSLFRELNYLATLNKNHPKLYDIFIADRDYIKMKYMK